MIAKFWNMPTSPKRASNGILAKINLLTLIELDSLLGPLKKRGAKLNKKLVVVSKLSHKSGIHRKLCTVAVTITRNSKAGHGKTRELWGDENYGAKKVTIFTLRSMYMILLSVA